MDRILTKLMPHTWLRWLTSVIVWSVIASLIGIELEHIVFGEADHTFSEHFWISMTTSAPLVACALMLIMRGNRLRCEALVLALTDPLTGLLNRRAFLGRLEKQNNGILFVLDLDHFKDVNDGYGHPVGDEVLCAMAAKMRELVRETDLVGRIGGEEFAIFVADLEADDAEELGARLCEGIHHVEAFSGNTIDVTSSVGLLQAKDGLDVKLMLRDADKALYEAKASGRACAVWAGDNTLDELWLPPQISA
jgi:diguanylate cyclase (GGDEF)-like protein